MPKGCLTTLWTLDANALEFRNKQHPNQQGSLLLVHSANLLLFAVRKKHGLTKKNFSVTITVSYFSLPLAAVIKFALRTTDESQLIFILSMFLLRIIFTISKITSNQQIMEKCRQPDEFQNTLVLFPLTYSFLFLVDISLLQ